MRSHVRLHLPAIRQLDRLVWLGPLRYLGTSFILVFTLRA